MMLSLRLFMVKIVITYIFMLSSLNKMIEFNQNRANISRYGEYLECVIYRP